MVVSGVVVLSYSLRWFIRIQGNRVFVFISIVWFIMCSDNRVHNGLGVPHHAIPLSSLHIINWRHWAYKMPVIYILSSVCVSTIKSMLSIVFYKIDGAVCLRLNHSLVKIVRVCVINIIIIIKSTCASHKTCAIECRRSNDPHRCSRKWSEPTTYKMTRLIHQLILVPHIL